MKSLSPATYPSTFPDQFPDPQHLDLSDFQVLRPSDPQSSVLNRAARNPLHSVDNGSSRQSIPSDTRIFSLHLSMNQDLVSQILSTLLTPQILGS